jgi:hypothetical protein
MIARSLRLVTVALVGLTVLAVASCDDDWDREATGVCRGTEVRRCRTVCDYWCDRWYGGCSPVCWDQCGSTCYPAPDPAPGPTEPGPSERDAAAPIPPTTNDGEGVLCTPCGRTDDCQSGSLCILPGGATDAGADGGARNGFCGQTCGTNPDCPAGFVCAQLGSVRQCLPTGGRCP